MSDADTLADTLARSLARVFAVQFLGGGLITGAIVLLILAVDRLT